jgi:aspartate racemase
MKTVGIIGGIGPESTIDYYRFIIASFLEKKNDGNYPQILINSINLRKLLDLIIAKQFDLLTDFLLMEIEKLDKAGADFAVLASNTAHIVFDRVQEKSPIPLISIIEETCQFTKKSGYSKVGLFGTNFVMRNRFYQDVFSKENISIILPDANDQDYIHQKYMNEWVKAIILPQTKTRLLTIIQKMKQVHNIQALILGGTEIPLILKAGDDPDIPFLDTTKIHVAGIIREIFQ